MDLLGWIIDKVGTIWDKLIEILPKCPLYYLESIPEIQPYLSMLNWFIPVSTMISIGVAWLECIALYYAYQWVLRWLKIIE